MHSTGPSTCAVSLNQPYWFLTSLNSSHHFMTKNWENVLHCNGKMILWWHHVWYEYRWCHPNENRDHRVRVRDWELKWLVLPMDCSQSSMEVRVESLTLVTRCAQFWIVHSDSGLQSSSHWKDWWCMLPLISLQWNILLIWFLICFCIFELQAILRLQGLRPSPSLLFSFPDSPHTCLMPGSKLFNSITKRMMGGETWWEMKVDKKGWAAAPG